MIDSDYTMHICTAPRRDSKHWSQGTITWGEIREWMLAPADRKESGNYVLGVLRESPCECKKCAGELALLRRATTVVTRSALTLDVDYPHPGFAEGVELALGCGGILHTTYSSTPDAPRWRLILPLDRPALPDEYHTAASVLMKLLGADQFDPGSVQPERYMFRPAASSPEYFHYRELDGPLLSLDDLLADFTDDLSTLPPPRKPRNKRDPFGIEGTVGAFNRAYRDFDELIAAYNLPYSSVGDRRWQLVGARSQGGLSEIGEGLVFSHHAHDPASGRACSAFDLVRLHRFGELDEAVSAQTPVNRLPSHDAMLELASVDARVVTELVGSDFVDEMTSATWTSHLQLTPKGGFKPVVGNWNLISEHDPAFAQLRYNELTLSIETVGELPWTRPARAAATLGPGDYADLQIYLDETYPGLNMPVERYLARLANTAPINPVRDYLESLTWDGVPRVETALPGVAPTAYTRLVARKSLVAAVARMFQPGIKWDHTLILFGDEGLGKSYWIEKLGRGWSATLGRIGDKDTLLTMRRSWIVVSDEGHSLRKADADLQKEFLTRTYDTFRAPYDKQVEAHPRHCVVWGATNDEVFLRRQQGNRRFLIVHCEERVDFDQLTDEYVDQVWAEAVHLYRSGERLYLDDQEAAAAASAREVYTEEDSLVGLISEYLDTPVPPEWTAWSPEQRLRWRRDRADGFGEEGTEFIDRVCTVQLWVEVLDKRLGDHRRTDLLELGAAMKQVPGWVKLPSQHRLPHYGPQTVFERVRSTQREVDDLL